VAFVGALESACSSAARAGRNLPVDTQPTAVQRAVVRAAHHHQIVRIIAATLRAQIQVVDIQIGGIPTPRNHTPPPISPEDFASSRRRRVLSRAPTLQSNGSHTCSTAHVGVGVRELAGIADVGVGVRDLSGATSQWDVLVSERALSGAKSQWGVGVRDLSGSTRGAGRELIGVALVGIGAFVGDTRVGAGVDEFG
jgi:hypothetical protein